MMDFRNWLESLVAQLETGATEQAQIHLSHLLEIARKAVYGMPSQSKGTEERRVYAFGQGSAQTARVSHVRTILLDIPNPLIPGDQRALELARLAMETWARSEAGRSEGGVNAAGGL